MVNGWWPDARNWIGKQAKSVGDAVARPFRETGRFFKRLFGGGRDRPHSPEVQMFEVPGNMSASVPTNLSIFGPTGGGGMGISAGDVADTVLDFVPIAGGVKDIYNGINEGNGWLVALGAGSIVLDVFTLGGSSLVKGSIKTGIKVGTKSIIRSAAKTGTNLLSSGELLRIENAATRIGKPITVVGSRATPGRVSNGVNTLTGKMADWDYVIPGLNSKNWSTIKNSLPGSRSILDNTPRNIDILPGPVWPGSPHITIYPR